MPPRRSPSAASVTLEAARQAVLHERAGHGEQQALPLAFRSMATATSTGKQAKADFAPELDAVGAEAAMQDPHAPSPMVLWAASPAEDDAALEGVEPSDSNAEQTSPAGKSYATLVSEYLHRLRNPGGHGDTS
jgi:hypothetical protein